MQTHPPLYDSKLLQNHVGQHQHSIWWVCWNHVDQHLITWEYLFGPKKAALQFYSKTIWSCYWGAHTEDAIWMKNQEWTFERSQLQDICRPWGLLYSLNVTLDRTYSLLAQNVSHILYIWTASSLPVLFYITSRSCLIRNCSHSNLLAFTSGW